MKSVNDIDSDPTVEDIRAAVEDIVASRGFLHSPQLVSFLRYVVEATLAGKAASGMRTEITAGPSESGCG